MREQHLDLLAFTPRGHIGLCPGDPTRHVSGALVDRTWHLACWHLRTAPLLELADVAVALAGAIEKRRSVIHRRPGRSQHHLAGRAEIDVGLPDRRQRRRGANVPSLASRLVEHRGYAARLRDRRPANPASRLIRKRCRQPDAGGWMPKHSSVRSIIVRAAPTSACRMARVASTSTMTRSLQINQVVVSVGKKGVAFASTGPLRSRIADREINFGTVSLAAPQAASSSVSRYSRTDRRVLASVSQSCPSPPAVETLLVGVGGNQAGIDGEALPPSTKPLRHAAPHPPSRTACAADRNHGSDRVCSLKRSNDLAPPRRPGPSRQNHR